MMKNFEVYPRIRNFKMPEGYLSKAEFHSDLDFDSLSTT